MVAERTSLENAYETTLTAEMGPVALVATVVTKGTLTSPTLLVIEPDDDGQREYIRFDGVFGGSTFVTTNVSNRYLTGSASPSNITHPAGSIVRSAALQQHIEDLHDRFDGLDHGDDLVGLSDDDHSLYHTDGRADTWFTGKSLADLGTKAHDLLTGLGDDDHPQYVLGADHDKALHDALGIDADTVDGVEAAGFTLIAHDLAGGAVHADVVAGGADGFMLGADKTKLDGLPAGTGFGGTPNTVRSAIAGAAGSATLLARSDHQHGASAGTPSDVGTANAAGGGTDFVRNNHIHRIANARAVAITGGAFKGTGTTLGSSDPGFTDTGSRTSVGRPSGWGSTLVIVNAAIQYSAGQAGVQLNGRVQVDSGLGVLVQSGSAEGEKGVTQIQPVGAIVTSDATIDIGVRLWRTNGTGTGTSKYITYTYLLIRAS